MDPKKIIMETKEKTKFVDRIADALRTAATEIEELEVKATLGKAEAEEKFEEIKKKFNLFIHESKSQINAGKEKIEELDAKFDELRLQLALGKAETIVAFKEQKRKLLLTLNDIETKIKTNETFKKVYAFVLIEIENFKAKLEILNEKFEKSKESAKTSFEKGKKEFDEFIDELKKKYNKKEENKWDNFQGEISEAFDHLKKAFSKS
jgi:hypothetical protein